MIKNIILIFLNSDGTTDVTRTLHFGTPSEEEKEAFTLVLLGNLDVERTTWPIALDINGADLDVLARRRLWEKFMDYNHGTGHGVGYFSVVHEDPCGIAKYVAQPFIKGMVVSNGFLSIKNIYIFVYRAWVL